MRRDKFELLSRQCVCAHTKMLIILTTDKCAPEHGHAMLHVSLHLCGPFCAEKRVRFVDLLSLCLRRLPMVVSSDCPRIRLAIELSHFSI